MQKQKIVDAYIEFLLENEKRPASVYKFAKSLKIKESDFYKHFNSLDTLENEIWKEWFEQTVTKIEADETYAGFSAREKFLTFLFTWIESLKDHRSYALFVYKHKKPYETEPAAFGEFKKAFLEYARNIIAEGRSVQELAERPFISEQYHKTLWWQVLFIFRFWACDSSKDFEKTDAAIEKTVNFAFDTMTKNAVDSFFDFAKFIVQSR